MANGDDLKEFPNVSSKLAAPKKLSAYEKERQIQEAKRQREQAETALALKKFEEEFAGPSNDSDDHSTARTTRDGSSGFSRAHGSTRDRFGGPGSPSPLPGPPPPLNHKKRRALDVMRAKDELHRNHDQQRTPGGRPQEDQRAEVVTERVPGPNVTLRLTSLPFNVSQSTIIELLRPYMEVSAVQLFQPEGNALGTRHACTAIVTVDSGVPPPTVDAGLTALKGRYLGCGHFLSIDKYLSTATLQNSVSTLLTGPPEEPFAAQKPKDEYNRGSLRNAPPPSHFAPPESYSARVPPVQSASAVVPVSTSIPTEVLKAVHVVVGALLAEPDPERAATVEAVLMNQEEVQMEERFAFLYDSRSPAGVYYRYLLWQADGISERRGRLNKPNERLFDDTSVTWTPAHPSLPYKGVTRLGQVADHADYDTDEEESSDEELGSNENAASAAGDEYSHLNPTQRARFAWLLATLPTSIGMLKKCDVAAVTVFAIKTAAQGANEIVDMLLLNVDIPFSSTQCKPDDSSEDEHDTPMSGDELPAAGIGAHPSESSIIGGRKDADDPSDAKLVGLYLISDILTVASTARVKSAYKYRTLLENGLLAQGTFERLSQLDKTFGWGKMRADKWKKKILYLLSVWEDKGVVRDEVQAQLRRPFTAAQPAVDERERKPSTDEPLKAPPKARFIKVGSVPSPSGSHVSSPDLSSVAAREKDGDQLMPDTDTLDGAPMGNTAGTPMDDLDGTPMEDLDGMPMDDLDGTPMGDLDGMPMEDIDGAPMDDEKTIKDQGDKPGNHSTAGTVSTATATQGEKAPVEAKGRAGAEDMFALSDED